MSQETTSDKPVTLPGVALDPVVRTLEHDDITAMDQRISYLADKFFPHLTRPYGRLCVVEIMRDAQMPNVKVRLASAQPATAMQSRRSLE